MRGLSVGSQSEETKSHECSKKHSTLTTSIFNKLAGDHPSFSISDSVKEHKFGMTP